MRKIRWNKKAMKNVMDYQNKWIKIRNIYSIHVKVNKYDDWIGVVVHWQLVGRFISNK